MITNRGSDLKLEVLRGQITDLEACLRGSSSSERWQALNTELQSKKLSLTALEKKKTQFIPSEGPPYQKRSSRNP